MTEPPRLSPSQTTEHEGAALPVTTLSGAADVDDRSLGRWLHPSSLLFEFAAGIRTQLIPAILALFSATTGSWIGGFLALLLFVGSMAAVVLRYLRLRYRLTGHDLIIDEGLVFRVHKTVPVQRIQNIDLVQNPFHRLLGVAEVRIETASGTEPEAVLRVLSLAEVESLRARIFARKQSSEGMRVTAESLAQPEPPAPSYWPKQPAAGTEPPRLDLSADRDPHQASEAEAVCRQPLIKLSLAQLAWAGIASNRGSVLLLVGLGIISQQAPAAFRTWDIETADVTRYLPDGASEVAWLAIAVAGLLGVLLAVKILSIAWYVLKFFDYTLESSGEGLHVSCGLLTRVSATVRRDRIQLISIHRTLIGRWLGIAAIRIESAGGGGDTDDPAATIARRWFMPVISERQIPAVMERLSPGLHWDEQAFDWHALSRGAVWRTRRVVALIAGSLAIAAAAVGVFSLAVAMLVFGGLGWWWAQRRAAATRYARSDEIILYRSGVFTKKCSLAFLDKVQSVTVGQSPLDRRWQMAKLSVDTIAAGPAEHRIAIPMLDMAFARSERDIICRAASAAR